MRGEQRRTARPARSGQSANTAAPRTPTVTAVGGRRGIVATMMIVIGIGLAALWLVVLLMQVQTNEAFILNSGSVDAFKPNFSLLLQIPNLFMGGISLNEALATVYGWGVELLVLGLTVGYEVIHVAMHQSGVIMAHTFRVLAIVSIGLNGWSDFNYGTLGSGFLGHLLFAVFCTSVVSIGGIAAATLIKHGIDNA